MGSGPYLETLKKRFEIACKKHGLNTTYTVSSRTDLFKPPPKAGDQLALDLGT